MNNNFMRQGGQGNRQRGRGNRNNRHRSSGGGGGGGGGNSSNKVFDSNGPDVKLRGTAQTIAEKYMQLGRDAQSSGDTVAAESYYQHAEHYYRIWASNQPQGASLVMTRKLGEEEFEEEQAAEDGEGEDAAEGQNSEVAASGENAEGQNQPQAEAGEGQRQNNNNNNSQRNNNRERFRPKWQNRRDRQDGNRDEQAPQGNASGNDAQAAPAAEIDSGPDNGQWEAPSFLQRPTPAPAPSVEAEASDEPPPPRRARAPRREREEAAPAAEEPTPQAE